MPRHDGAVHAECWQAGRPYLSHTQHGVQVIEGPRLVSRGSDEVLVGGVQRHSNHLSRVIRQNCLQEVACCSFMIENAC